VEKVDLSVGFLTTSSDRDSIILRAMITGFPGVDWGRGEGGGGGVKRGGGSIFPRGSLLLSTTSRTDGFFRGAAERTRLRRENHAFLREAFSPTLASVLFRRARSIDAADSRSDSERRSRRARRHITVWGRKGIEPPLLVSRRILARSCPPFSQRKPARRHLQDPDGGERACSQLRPVKVGEVLARGPARLLEASREADRTDSLPMRPGQHCARVSRRAW